MTTFTLLLGPQQKNVPAELVSKMMGCAASVQLIRLTKPGNNALDIALAYHLGQAVLGDPTGCFHIISGDRGYESLIEHLRSRHVHVRQHQDYTTLDFLSQSEAQDQTSEPIPNPKAAVNKSAAAKSNAPAVAAKAAKLRFQELEAKAIKHLRTQSTGRPTRQKKLLTHLLDHFRSKTTEADVKKLIEHWRTKGFLETVDVPQTPGNFRVSAYKF